MKILPVSPPTASPEIGRMLFLQRTAGYPSFSTLSQKEASSRSLLTWISQKISAFFSWIWSFCFSLNDEEGEISFFKQPTKENSLTYSLILNGKKTENEIELEKKGGGVFVLAGVHISTDYLDQVVPLMQHIIKQEKVEKIVVTRWEFAKILFECGLQTKDQIRFYPHPNKDCIHRQGEKGIEYVNKKGGLHGIDKGRVDNHCLQDLSDQGIELIIQEARNKKGALTSGQKSALEAVEKQLKTLQKEESVEAPSEEKDMKEELVTAEERLRDPLIPMTAQEKRNVEEYVAGLREQLKAISAQKGFFSGLKKEQAHRRKYTTIALEDLFTLSSLVDPKKKTALRGIRFAEVHPALGEIRFAKVHFVKAPASPKRSGLSS